MIPSNESLYSMNWNWYWSWFWNWNWISDAYGAEMYTQKNFKFFNFFCFGNWQTSIIFGQAKSKSEKNFYTDIWEIYRSFFLLFIGFFTQFTYFLQQERDQKEMEERKREINRIDINDFQVL